MKSTIVSHFSSKILFRKSKSFASPSLYSICLVDSFELLEVITILSPLSEIIFEKEQPGDVPITFANIEKAKLLINYAPKTSVKEGLGHFKSWIIKHNELVNGK